MRSEARCAPEAANPGTTNNTTATAVNATDEESRANPDGSRETTGAAAGANQKRRQPETGRWRGDSTEGSAAKLQRPGLPHDRAPEAPG